MKINQFIRNGLRVFSRMVVVLGLPTLALAANAQGVGFSLEHPGAQKVVAVQKLVTAGLMAQPEILALPWEQVRTALRCCWFT